MSKGFDCWGLGPPAAAAKAAGFTWRTWYSSFDSSKDGPLDGPAQYAEQGIWSFTNFETTVDRVVTGGYAGGQADMAHAIAEYVARGMPEGAAVALSADEAIPTAAFPAALRYYQGAAHAAAGSYLVGAYGEQALIAYLKGADAIQVGWRSMSAAWPGGPSLESCDLVQTGAGTIGGMQVDLDQALVPFFGQWMPGTLAPRGDTVTVQWDDVITGPNGRPDGNSVRNILTDTGRLRDALLGDPSALSVYGAASPLQVLIAGAAAIPGIAVGVKALAVPSVTLDPGAAAAALAAVPGFVDALAAGIVKHLLAAAAGAAATG